MRNNRNPIHVEWFTYHFKKQISPTSTPESASRTRTQTRTYRLVSLKDVSNSELCQPSASPRKTAHAVEWVEARRIGIASNANAGTRKVATAALGRLVGELDLPANSGSSVGPDSR